MYSFPDFALSLELFLKILFVVVVSESLCPQAGGRSRGDGRRKRDGRTEEMGEGKRVPSRLCSDHGALSGA